MTASLTNRSILLIISGGIAAYKSLDLVRRLRDEGASVQCILTEGGSKFITPLSVSTLSGKTAYTDLFSAHMDELMGHIRLSRTCDLIVIAPASANMLAKIAHGLADNLASAVVLASDKPVLIAPSMNTVMWQNAATQANIATLRARGVKQVGPNSGFLACGEDGTGRMSDPEDIVHAIKNHFIVAAPLSGLRALVTSGPTYEPIDPVRFIGNRSSGKQGHAIAVALAMQGADVTLITGPTVLPDPTGIQTIHIETAQDMLTECQAAGVIDIAVCAAAVADWRPSNVSRSKLKKGDEIPALTLTENTDILATLSRSATSRPKLIVGFAAETDNLLANAEAKFIRKGCDWLVANNVDDGRVFGDDENEVTLLQRDTTGQITTSHWDRSSKQDIANKLATCIVGYFAR